MNKIYFSIYDALKTLEKFNISNAAGLDSTTGWSRFILYTERYLIEYGYKLVESPIEADIELYLGQPPMKKAPSMSPNIMFTMYESSILPPEWVASMNKWDRIINPSKWGVTTFCASGVNTYISRVPLFLTDEFEFKERNKENWTYLAMGLQLLDRKNINVVGEIFLNGEMPEDTNLVIKANPILGNLIEMDNWFAHNVHFIQSSLPSEDLVELIQSAHVSVNPSSAEGFGLIPIENMSTGCCTLLSDYSALADIVKEGCNIPIKCSEIQSPFAKMQGIIGFPDKEDLLKKMIWTYEHREEALEIGKAGAQYVREEYSPEHFCQRLETVLKDVFIKYPKRLKKVPKKNYLYKDVAFKQIKRMEAAR